MAKNSQSISKTAGLPPGTLMHLGEHRAGEVRITIIDYNQTEWTEYENQPIDECFELTKRDSVTWINVDGLHDIDKIEQIGKAFGLHPLLLEDVLNTRHRPKIEDYDDYLFLTLKMLGINQQGSSIVTEQVSFVLGDGWLISFQEQQGDIFDGLRQRMKEGKGIIREQGVDYLLYRLIDTVVDYYFFVTDHFSDVTEVLETKVIEDHDESNLLEIQRLKKMLIDFRRSVLPLREVIGAMQKDASTLIKGSTVRYLRDVYEHIIQLSDSIDTQRDILASIMDLYLSGVSNKMNKVMQLLTIISTIFIPLTFIAGIYGMNFDHIPELHWRYGYLGVWVLMLVIMIVMVIFFRRRKWL